MVRGFLGLFGVASDSNGVKVTVIVVAILFMYVLDFSINTGKLRCPCLSKSYADESQSRLVFGRS
jgi:hypothetical protein